MPFLLHYFGEGFDHDVYTVAVDDKNLYWRATGNRIMVMPKEGGEPEPFVVCPSCEFLPEPDDHGLVYFLDGAQLLQVDRETRKGVRIDLPWSHAGGALLVEGEYVYTAMPGCAAILRINRSTWAIEEMYVEGVAYPGRGFTTLARAGEGLVCGSPTDIYAFDKWGAPANHLSSEGDCAFDLVVVDGFVHWWQTPSGNLPDSIGTVPLTGGAVSWADMEKLGGSSEIAYVPPADAVVTGTARGLQGFSRDTGLFDFQVGADKVLSLDADDSAVFCAFTGKRFRVVDGVDRQDWPYWLARIPFEAIVEAQKSR